jgi:uncharacterized protein YprB with RNaseH-like and TPR domain
MTMMQAAAGMGALWQRRMDSVREYDVVRDGNVFGSGIFGNFVYSSEYTLARQYLDRLMAKYGDVSFEEALPGKYIPCETGDCYCITGMIDLPDFRVDRDRIRKEMHADLSLVKRIGHKTKARLTSRGYTSLDALLRHPKYHSDAADALRKLSEGNTLDLMNLISARHPKSDPLVLGTAGFHEPEDFMFFDIETLGLFSRPIILFGVGTICKKKIRIDQYLLRNIDEEHAALGATMEHFNREKPALVTFNGKTFDLPYLLDRLAYYGHQPPPRIPHFDVLHFSRRRWKNQYPSMRLTSLEREVLGIARSDDIPGALVPEFYSEYIRTGNCGPLIPIVDHNRQDVYSLALIFYHLLEDAYGS